MTSERRCQTVGGLEPQRVVPASAVVLGVVVVAELLLGYFRTPADVFNRTFRGFLYAFLVSLVAEGVVNHARAGKVWGAWYVLLLALAIFVLYHLLFGGALLVPFAASMYFGALAWRGLRRQRVSMRQIIGAVVALFCSGLFLVPLPALFVRAWPVVFLSLILSAFLCRTGIEQLKRSSLRDRFGTGALAFFAGMWFSSGVLIVRTLTGYME